LAAGKAIKKKAEKCMERMDGNRDMENRERKKKTVDGVRDLWDKKKDACNVLLDLQDDEVVKYIHALILDGATEADSLWVSMDMGRFDESMEQCKDALGGRRTLMQCFKDVMPKCIGKFEL
jgi:hypothetical protein